MTVRTAVLLLCLSAATARADTAARSEGPTDALAKPITPQTPVGPRDMPAVIDRRQPAFVPKFAQVNNPPAGQYEERNYAYRYGGPAPIYAYGGFGWAYGNYGLGGSYGYGVYSSFGRGPGTWGGTSVNFR